jgi:hypothetical protein
MGMGKTIQECIKKSTGDYIFIYDSDLEYDHYRSIYMARYAKKRKLDVVMGSRMKRKYSMIKKAIERTANIATFICNFLINKFYNKKFTDIIGAKLYRVKSIKKIPIDCFNEGFEFNFTSKILKMKLNVAEIFINYEPRKEGVKKIKFYHMVNAIYQIIKIKFFY